MSKHLRVLRTSGLVEEEHGGPDARVRTYRLRPEPFTVLEEWLAEVQRSWSEQLDAFKDYAERSQGGAGS
jgi:DNA-binding transcriptional ArsR family regulator